MKKFNQTPKYYSIDKNGPFMRKIFLLLGLVIPLSISADVMNVYYEGIVTEISATANHVRLGESFEKPNGYTVGDSISGMIAIDTDIAESFPATTIANTMVSWAPPYVYNTPNPHFENLKIQYMKPFATRDDNQGFITGTHNPEPSVINGDKLVIYNGANSTTPSNDYMTITNRDNLYDYDAEQRMPPVQNTTEITFSATSFLNGISLNQNFELSSSELVNKSGFIRYANGFGTGVMSRYPAVNGRVAFELSSVRVETVSSTTAEQCD